MVLYLVLPYNYLGRGTYPLSNKCTTVRTSLLSVCHDTDKVCKYLTYQQYTMININTLRITSSSCPSFERPLAYHIIHRASA